MYMYNYCFQVPVLKAGNGLTVRGLVSVAKQIVRQSESPELKGRHGFETNINTIQENVTVTDARFLLNPRLL